MDEEFDQIEKTYKNTVKHLKSLADELKNTLRRKGDVPATISSVWVKGTLSVLLKEYFNAERKGWFVIAKRTWAGVLCQT